MFPNHFCITQLCMWTLMLTLPGRTLLQQTSSGASLYFYEPPTRRLDIPYSNSTHNSGAINENMCFTLLEQGPCDPSQWLVYDKYEAQTSGRLRVVCRPRQCQAGLHYIPAHNRCYTRNVIETQVCPYSRGFQYKYDHFGEGRCLHGELSVQQQPNSCSCGRDSSCLSNSLDRRCYLLYKRGPCRMGSVVTPSEFGFVECRVDPCFGLPEVTALGMVPIRLHNGETKCFELGTRGPCAEYMFLTITGDSHADIAPNVRCAAFGEGGGGLGGGAPPPGTKVEIPKPVAPTPGLEP